MCFFFRFFRNPNGKHIFNNINATVFFLLLLGLVYLMRMTLWDIFSKQMSLWLQEMISLAARHIEKIVFKFKNAKIASECVLVVKCESQYTTKSSFSSHEMLLIQIARRKCIAFQAHYWGKIKFPLTFCRKILIARKPDKNIYLYKMNIVHVIIQQQKKRRIIFLIPTKAITTK